MEMQDIPLKIKLICLGSKMQEKHSEESMLIETISKKSLTNTMLAKKASSMWKMYTIRRKPLGSGSHGMKHKFCCTLQKVKTKTTLSLVLKNMQTSYSHMTKDSILISLCWNQLKMIKFLRLARLLDQPLPQKWATGLNQKKSSKTTT